jgi:hypothetical protein
MGALRPAAAAAAVAALAAAGVVLLAHGGSAPEITPSAPIVVRTSFDRGAMQFGDAVTARVTVALDRDAVRAGTLRVDHDLAPLTLLSAPSTTRTVNGRLETVSIAQRVACLTDPCLARAITLPRVQASVNARDGTEATASAAWRRLRIGSRVTAKDLASASPRFAAETTPGSPSYGVAPATAATILAIVAALAAAGTAALLVPMLRRRRPAVSGDELTRALRLVREAEERPVPDRRRALALLARLLRSDDRSLGQAASDLAWSAPSPEPPQVEALLADVEREEVR